MRVIGLGATPNSEEYKAAIEAAGGDPNSFAATLGFGFQPFEALDIYATQERYRAGETPLPLDRSGQLDADRIDRYQRAKHRLEQLQADRQAVIAHFVDSETPEGTQAMLDQLRGYIGDLRSLMSDINRLRGDVEALLGELVVAANREIIRQLRGETEALRVDVVELAADTEMRIGQMADALSQLSAQFSTIDTTRMTNEQLYEYGQAQAEILDELRRRLERSIGRSQFGDLLKWVGVVLAGVVAYKVAT